MRMRIEDRLRDSVLRHGGDPALVAGRARHSYAELDLKSERLAAALQCGGIRRGDRVALFMDDGWEAVVSLFGVLKAGGVVMPIAADAAADALGDGLRTGGAIAVVTQSRLATLVATALTSVLSVKLIVLAGGDRARAGGTCISFEDAVGRVGRMPTLALPGIDADAAIVFGGQLPLTHRAVVADAAEATIAGDGILLPPLAERAGVVRLVAAIGAGRAMVARSPFVREAEAERRTRATARRDAPFGVSNLLDVAMAGGTPAFQR